MNHGVFITGTDAGVGMTHVASVLAAALQRRLDENGGGRVGVWKPVQTGVRDEAPLPDSAKLVLGSGLPIRESETFSYAFPDRVVPWMAAQRIGARISISQLAEEGLSRLAACDRLVVDGAGGLAAPLTDRRVVADLAAALALPVLIVARPGIGTVNHTLLTVAYARGAGLRPIGVVLNGYRDGQADIMEENAMMIERFADVPVIGKLPWLPGAPASGDDWSTWRERWADVSSASLDLDKLP
ncbi:dethiobiotin synthase [Paenibacillus antri]|nr:dethiobiotin synthase [Paenibacillus antri]